MTWKAVTEHAVRRAHQRHGVVMSSAMWEALARSIAAGEHRYLGPRAGGLQRWMVLLACEDGGVLRMPVVTSREGTIVTVLPRRTRAPRAHRG